MTSLELPFEAFQQDYTIIWFYHDTFVELGYRENLYSKRVTAAGHQDKSGTYTRE